MRLSDEFIQIILEVKHECGCTCMRLGESEIYPEIFHLNSGAERETRNETAGISAHVGACLVVIAESYIEILA